MFEKVNISTNNIKKVENNTLRSEQVKFVGGFDTYQCSDDAKKRYEINAASNFLKRHSFVKLCSAILETGNWNDGHNYITFASANTAKQKTFNSYIGFQDEILGKYKEVFFNDIETKQIFGELLDYAIRNQSAEAESCEQIHQQIMAKIDEM